MVSLISEIIESPQQLALLAFLLIAPNRSFSVKELSLRLKISIDKVNQAGKDLEKQNYLGSFSSGGIRFYMLNQRHAQVPTLQEEILKTEKPWQDELYSSLKKIGQMKGIFLSGIFVGETALPVDMLLVGKVSLNKLDNFLRLANKLMGRELNYSIMSPEEFVLRKDTFDRFIKDIFDYHHLVVLDDFTNKPTKNSKLKTIKKKK